MSDQDWLCHNVPRETSERLGAFASILRHENERQNLVARSTIENLWSRHLLDSAQLLDHAPGDGSWLDIGSGGGLPGLVIAILRPAPIYLIEPRRLRAEFLRQTAEQLALANVIVVHSKVERVAVSPAQVISARAVAPPTRLFRGAGHLSNAETIWVLPLGRSAREEVARVREEWHGVFDLCPSSTDPAASILIARQVQPRTRP